MTIHPNTKQILADVFDCEVLVADCSDAAAVGAALRAEHGLACRKCVVVSDRLGMI